jgi:phosphoribosylformimino-5-aminoimidazole carboxamide ribotide isomerase
MDLYPAIDLRGGRCVRLVEGDFGAETVYGNDPVAVAVGFAVTGARWIHVVDLDAARTGEPVNRPLVARIAAAVGSDVRVQAGGGVRGVDDAGELLSAGVTRVVVGTAAVQRPELVAEIAAEWPGRVAVGLDHRGGEVQVQGWTAGGGRQVTDVVPEAMAAGAAAVIVTDISRDGRLVGPDLSGLASLVARTGGPIIASGGVRDVGDIRALARIGVAGVIAGKALYEGRLDLADALAAVAA